MTIAPNASFTTGKLAYKTLPATLNLSSYQQLSFFFRQYSGTLNSANGLSIALCSDTTGDVVVNTAYIPTHYNTSNPHWDVVDFGTALGTTINSIALYLNEDLGAAGYALFPIVACKAPNDPNCLTLQHLVGKNVAGEPWYKLMGFKGTVAWFIDGNYDVSTTYPHTNYQGTTETVSTYAYLPTEVKSLTNKNTILASGTVGSPIIVSGGWDRTDMSTQTLETCLATRARGSDALTVNKDYIHLSNFSIVGHADAVTLYSSIGCIIDINHLVYVSNGVTFGGTATNNTVTISTGSQSAQVAGGTQANYLSHNTINITSIVSCTQNRLGHVVSVGTGCWDITVTQMLGVYNGFSIQGQGNVTCTTLSYCKTGVYATVDLTLSNSALSNCTYGLSGNNNSNITLKNVTITGSSLYDIYSIARLTAKNSSFTSIFYSDLYPQSQLTSDRHDQTPGSKTFCQYGTIETNSSVRHTASGYSWKFAPTSILPKANLLNIPICRVALTANVTATISIWAYKTTSPVIGVLYCEKNQLAGINSLIETETTPATINSWQQLSINVTATESGIIEIRFGVYNDTSLVYIDDLTVSN